MGPTDYAAATSRAISLQAGGQVDGCVPTSGTVLPNVYVTVAVAVPVVDWPLAKFPPPPVMVSVVAVNTGILKFPAPVYGANMLVSVIVAEPVPLRR